ncbi:acetate--CoA ligase family protein [Candidatus Woesebacteria bacterium]|nr:acetate--CoA ligase family protein [Candidatus Woesebacteria bacterium]HNV45083.1 acetate--CoA ligase family protein [Candidatus Woesebacteria bacterium]HOI05199.1 acetate--CoA ligase family protein [Candidatus Woesebacteria bacterium]HOP39161.1 acetate--CoA ligase family protein [Candidatus Woesebacteria bacterium]HPR14206.1 acetate--CoA ligase family protein [Candidatus Woesebacteria bacterium]
MNFQALFQPQAIAIIGASSREKTVGNDVVKNLVNQGYAGKIYPINPKIDELYGLKVYHDIKDLDQKIDLVVVAIPAKFVASAIDEAASKGAQAAIVISAGFKEAGNLALEQELAATCRRHGIILVGPNCLGVINAEHKMNASFAAIMPEVGNVAFMSQSGALCTAVLDYAQELGLGFSKFISIGNKAALDELALIKYLHEDPQTKVICLYAEALDNATAIIQTLKELNRGKEPKPVIVLKSGKTAAGAGAIASHTGSLSGGDNAYQALFNQAGIIRAQSVSELFDLASIFSNNPLKEIKTVTIITNAGGPGVLTTDAVIENGLEMAKLEEQTIKKLKSFLPAAANTHNPVDVLGDAVGEVYEKTLAVIGDDRQTDAILVLLTPQTMTEPVKTAQAIVNLRKKTDKVIAVSLMGRDLVADGVKILKDNKIANTTFPESAALGLGALAKFVAWTKIKEDKPLVFNDVDRERVAQIFKKAKKEGKTSFPEAEAMKILQAYNFPLLKSAVAKSASEAKQILEKFACAVAMKIVSPDILHKSDVGGVMLNVTADNVEAKFQAMMTTVRKNKPQAKLEGVLLMEMAPQGHETILGINKNSLGSMLMFGLGGIYVEVFKDVTFAFPPLSKLEIEKMIGGLKSNSIFMGARGQAAIDQKSLIEAIARLAQLAGDFPQIKELDINPLLLTAQGVKVLDARIVIE